MYKTLGKATMLLTAAGLLQTAAAGTNPEWDQYITGAVEAIYPEEQSLTNPPFFHWQEHDGAVSYLLIVDDVGGFQYEFTTSRNFHTPAARFAPGHYRWRVFPRDGSGRGIGEPFAARFELPPSADGIETDMEELNVASPPRLVGREEDLERLRNADGPVGIYRERLVEHARAELPSHLRNPAEPTRYPDGKFNYQLWSANNSICFQIEDQILTRALAFHMTGEDSFADSAVSLMLAVTDWDPIGATGVWENDHSAQALLRGLSAGYDLLREHMSDSDKSTISRVIATRSADLYAFLNPFVGKLTASGTMNDPDNNHPWFVASALGLGGLALAGEHPDAEDWAAFAAQLYHGVFLCRGDSKGGWHEGNDYWSYTLLFVFQFADALEKATGVSLYEDPWLRNTGAFKVYAHPPVGAFVPFGDCKHYPPTDLDKLSMMRLASRHQDPLLWRYVHSIPEEITGIRMVHHALLWADGMPASPPETDAIPNAVHYEDLGWIISNTDVFDVAQQFIFAFRCGPFAGRSFGHTNADLNHFILTAGGDKLLWDAGYYDGYLTPHHRNFARLSDSHNTILVNGTGQQVHIAGLDGVITHYEDDGDTITVVGDASKPLIYGGRLVRFIRTINYTIGDSLTVEDDLFARELSHFSFLLHSEFPIVYTPGTREIRITGNQYELIGTFQSDEPVTATLRDTFPVPPRRPAGKEHLWPDQYHLELRTTEKIESWTPRLEVKLRPVASNRE